MEKTIIKLGIGVSLPLTLAACYVVGRASYIIGKYEAYKDVAVSKSNDTQD